MLKTYTKKSEISYAFGVSPTIELLTKQPKSVSKILLNPKGSENSGITNIIELCEKHNIPIETNQQLIEKLAANENTYAVGVFNKYASQLLKEENHVVLVNPSDLGNLGTICRTMLGFNFSNLALVKPAVDIFDPKVIRASMGAIFGVNFEYFETVEDYQSKFNHTIYTFSGVGKSSLTDIEFKPPYSLIFGNEGQGLDQKYINLGESIKIPQSSEIDSFNLAVSVGIVLYVANNIQKKSD